MRGFAMEISISALDWLARVVTRFSNKVEIINFISLGLMVYN
jgi:hypothetical protein